MSVQVKNLNGERNRRKLPFYLPQKPSREAQEWIGRRLKQERRDSIEETAARAKVVPRVIKDIEKGRLRLTLGSFHKIVQDGYGIQNFPAILDEMYKKLPRLFNPTGSRRFVRDFHYSLSRRVENKKKVFAPLFVGGDPDNFLWGIPMRRLEKQVATTELLELAPMKKRVRRGFFPRHEHLGTEIIVVVYGTITIHFGNEDDADDAERRTLAQGDCIHFSSKRPHYIENDEDDSTAFLLVIRVP